METIKKMETCSICGKKLNFWNTQFKRHEGKKVCTKCAFELAKQEMSKMQSAGEKIQKIGKKLTIGITIPIILFVVGLITLPIGIIFWVIGILVFCGIFFGNKAK